jgi:hypothetical protein
VKLEYHKIGKKKTPMSFTTWFLQPWWLDFFLRSFHFFYLCGGVTLKFSLMWCLSLCVFVADICGLRPRQTLWGAGWGATTFYTSSVDAWCSLGPNGALSRPDGGAQDLQGRLTVFEGHGYPLVYSRLKSLCLFVAKNPILGQQFFPRNYDCHALNIFLLRWCLGDNTRMHKF